MTEATTFKVAFKEWAVICRALSEGRQALILRKGGIAESGEGFRPEHDRFWLYPTYVHQQQTGITADLGPLLDQVEAARPPAGVVRLESQVEVAGIYRVQDIVAALKLTGLHGWSADTVRARFAYREPGLWVLVVRVRRLKSPVELPETPEYAGCRTWVELNRAVEAGGEPVLTDREFRDVVRAVEDRLQPSAWV
jgi:hypothetical protein